MAGGGGGSSNDGLPGAAMDGIFAGTRIDSRNGTTATVERPGEGGDSGSVYNRFVTVCYECIYCGYVDVCCVSHHSYCFGDGVHTWRLRNMCKFVEQ